MIDPAEIGRKALKALAEGRNRRLAQRRERAAELRELVERAARLDRADGKPERGRAGRVARRLQIAGVEITERWTREILSELSGTTSTRAA